MGRLLTLATFFVAFSLALSVNAQDKAAAGGAAKAKADKKAGDHSKHDADRPESTWKMDGNFDVRVDHSLSDKLNHMFFRGILGAKANIEDSLYGYLSVYSLAESNKETVVTDEDTEFSVGPPALNLYQAWVKWVPSEDLKVKAGIFDTSFFGYTNLYEDHPEVLRGAIVKWKTPFGKLSALYARDLDLGAYEPPQAQQTNPFRNAQQDSEDEAQDVQASYVGLNFKVTQLPELVSKLKFSYLRQNGNPALQNIDTKLAGDINTYGGSAKLGLQGVHVKGSLYMQSTSGGAAEEAAAGNQEDADGSDGSNYVFDVKLRYSVPQFLNSTVWAGYHRDSADYQPLFYNKHKNAGYNDILEWGNLTYFNVGLKVVPKDGIYLGAGYHVFSKTDPSGGINFYNAPSGWEATNSNEASIGTELDVWAKKKFDNGLSAKLRYANFSPKNTAIAADQKDERVELRLVSNF